MDRRWEDDVQVLEPRRREQEAPARPAREIARVLALQRSAGNQAVVAALRRPVLARFTDEDVEDMEAPDKKRVQAAKKLFGDNFNYGKKYYEFEDDDWETVLSRAKTVQGLEDDVKRRIANAEEKRKKASEEKASEPSAPVRQPGAAQTSILDYQPPVKPPKPQKQKPTKQPQPQATVIQTGFNYGPTPSQTPTSVPVQQQPVLPNLPQSMSAIQKSLENWNGTDHTGKGGTHLSLTQVELIIQFIKDRWAAKPFKGIGSGKWKGEYQLKVAELGQVGGKSATWHLTVTKAVYDNMSADPAKS